MTEAIERFPTIIIITLTVAIYSIIVVGLVKKLKYDNMEKNTHTTLGTLRTGDRFTFPNKMEVWEVITKGKNNTYINQIGIHGKVHKFDVIKTSKANVRFLRHTRPEPGECCIYDDLKPGEVFHLPDDIINEYIKTDLGCVPVNVTRASNPAIIKPAYPVIFVRKEY